MPEADQQTTLTDDSVISKIYLIRGQKIMIDKDLAELYGVEVKVLKQAVRRNLVRFPVDFMFEMTNQEFLNWRSQFVTSNLGDKMGLRYSPFCFSELGVTMLSCMLNSQRAINVNIRIIRIFTKMREMLLIHKDILLQVEKIERHINRHDEDIKLIFEYLKKLLIPDQPPRARIGFRRNDERD